jgi:SMI1 / KNR4 family (SUKH-1)
MSQSHTVTTHSQSDVSMALHDGHNHSDSQSVYSPRWYVVVRRDGIGKSPDIVMVPLDSSTKSHSLTLTSSGDSRRTHHDDATMSSTIPKIVLFSPSLLTGLPDDIALFIAGFCTLNELIVLRGCSKQWSYATQRMLVQCRSRLPTTVSVPDSSRILTDSIFCAHHHIDTMRVSLRLPPIRPLCSHRHRHRHHSCHEHKDSGAANANANANAEYQYHSTRSLTLTTSTAKLQSWSVLNWYCAQQTGMHFFAECIIPYVTQAVGLSLMPGADVIDVKRAEQKLGMKFPYQLVAIWLAHNGQHNEDLHVGIMFERARLLSMQAAVAEHNRRFSGTDLIPISNERAGNQVICIDGDGIIWAVEGRFGIQRYRKSSSLFGWLSKPYEHFIQRWKR